MRRTRSGWQYVLYAVPVIVAAGGITYLTKYQSNLTARFRNNAASSTRNPAQVQSGAKNIADKAPGDVHTLQQHIKKKLAELDEDEDAPEKDLKEETSFPVSAAKPGNESREPASAKSGEVCHSQEFAGVGTDESPLSKKEWDQVMAEFHDAKTLLTAWLKDHKAQFSDKTYQWMSARVSKTKLQRPPSADEPDLAWRGVGVLADNHAEEPLIRIGGGFAKWVASDQRRARFELTRILVQEWAPCDMAKVDSAAPAVWNGYLHCMDVGGETDSAKACSTGTYSEAAWAVSTAIAAVASPPGCRIPAFEKASAAECTKKLGASL